MSRNFDQSKGKTKGNPHKIGSEARTASCSASTEKSEMIGEALKSFYQTTLNEDVPDEFQNLLDQLD